MRLTITYHKIKLFEAFIRIRSISFCIFIFVWIFIFSLHLCFFSLSIITVITMDWVWSGGWLLRWTCSFVFLLFRVVIVLVIIIKWGWIVIWIFFILLYLLLGFGCDSFSDLVVKTGEHIYKLIKDLEKNRSQTSWQIHALKHTG